MHKAALATLIFVLTSATSLSANAQSAEPHGWLNNETLKTRFGDFEFKNGYPTPAAADALLDQLKFNRAIEVYLTQIPAVAIFAEHRGIARIWSQASQPSRHLGNADGRQDDPPHREHRDGLRAGPSRSEEPTDRRSSKLRRRCWASPWTRCSASSSTLARSDRTRARAASTSFLPPRLQRRMCRRVTSS